MITKWLCVFDADAGVHVLCPVDFILTIAPQFKESEIIEEARPMKGRTLIRHKSQNGVSTDHEFQEIIDALGKFNHNTHVVRVDEGKRELTISPARRKIEVPDGSNIIDILKS